MADTCFRAQLPFIRDTLRLHLSIIVLPQPCMKAALFLVHIVENATKKNIYVAKRQEPGQKHVL